MQHSEGNYPASRLPLGCFSQWQLFLTRCIGSVSNPSQKCSYSNIYETGSHTRKTFLAFRYAKELTGSNPWSYKPEQILFDCRKKLPVRLVSTEACALCSFQCSSVLLQNFLRLLGVGLPAARGQWAPPQQKNRWRIFALSLRPHEAFLQPPWNLCRSLFLGSYVFCHWTYSYSRTSGLGWLSTK